jgi:hypothetical protein
MLFIGKNKLHYVNIGGHISRNTDDRCIDANTLDYNLFHQKLTISDDNNSIESKEIFNFSPSEVKKMSLITRDELSPVKNYESPSTNKSEKSEHLTPQEIEEYYFLKKKQVELEQRIKEIESK